MTHRLLARFRERSSDPALIWHGETVAFDDLAVRVDAWQQRLEEDGPVAGEVCAVVGDQSVDACAALLALMIRRAIAVPLCSLPEAQHESCFEVAGVTRVIDGSARTGEMRRRRAEGPVPPLIGTLRIEGEPGLVVFSSGSTGHPKAMLWNPERLVDKHFEARRGYRTLLVLRLDHLGGLNTLFHALCSGGSIVVPSGREVETLCRAIEEHRIELLPATPTFLRMLLIGRAHERHDLSSLRIITYGTEPMSAATLEDLAAAFPQVRLKQTYGLSELGVLPTRSRDRDSLWLQVGGDGVETRVRGGTLWIRAPAAMLGYLNAPTAFDEDGWFDTQDSVVVDGDYLRILGRSTEIINVGGHKVHPAEVEDVLTRAENVLTVAVYARPSSITGQIVAARISLATPEDPREAERRLIAFCRPRLAPYQVPMLIEFTEAPLQSERSKLVRSAEGVRDV